MPILMIDCGEYMASVFINPADPAEFIVMLTFETDDREDMMIRIPVEGLIQLMEVLRATR